MGKIWATIEIVKYLQENMEFARGEILDFINNDGFFVSKQLTGEGGLFLKNCTGILENTTLGLKQIYKNGPTPACRVLAGKALGYSKFRIQFNEYRCLLDDYLLSKYPTVIKKTVNPTQ